MDGSPGGYYFAANTSSNSWIIELEGGGECASKKLCDTRKGTALGMQVPEEIERRIFGCLESEEGLLGELTIENALGKEQKEVVSPGNPVMKKKISRRNESGGT